MAHLSADKDNYLAIQNLGGKFRGMDRDFFLAIKLLVNTDTLRPFRPFSALCWDEQRRVRRPLSIPSQIG